EFYEDIIIRDEKIEQDIQKINESLESKEILGDPIPGSIFLKKSSLYYKKRDLANALKNLELALKNFEDENDEMQIAICHNEIGLIQEETGFFDQAIYHFNRSLDILKNLNDNQKVIKILNNLGNTYYLIKDLEHSYEFYQEALNLSRQGGTVIEEIKSSSNLVEVLYLLKDYDRIKRILERNTEFFKENQDAYGMIQTQVKYGKLYFLIGEDYDLSYEKLDSALGLIDKVKENLSVYIKAKLEWECLLYLGKIYLLWDNLVDAENCLLQSLEAVRIFEIKESINEGEILESLTELHSLKGDDEKAIEYCNLSFEIYYKYGDNKKMAEIKTKIGKIFLEGEKDMTKAIEFLEDALDIYENIEYTKKSAEILHKLGDIYLSRGMSDVAQENFERARDYYEELHDNYSYYLINEKINSLIERKERTDF
ncbi:MAG: tetratricopeptide repeat protein, partial [Promethearchaeota archaeon]